jgi:hypothetical protein
MPYAADIDHTNAPGQAGSIAPKIGQASASDEGLDMTGIGMNSLEAIESLSFRQRTVVVSMELTGPTIGRGMRSRPLLPPAILVRVARRMDSQIQTAPRNMLLSNSTPQGYAWWNHKGLLPDEGQPWRVVWATIKPLPLRQNALERLTVWSDAKAECGVQPDSYGDFPDVERWVRPDKPAKWAWHVHTRAKRYNVFIDCDGAVDNLSLPAVA